MTPDPDALDRLADLPSAGLGHWPTPLHRLPRFEAELGVGAGTELWIKRDDVQGVALAGNKIRKFDLVVGQARVDGHDTLVTTGAVQSNSARTGAAAAAAVGMDSVLLLSGREPEAASANLLLDRLVGGEVRYAGNANWNELNQGVDDIVAELRAAGRSAFAAPVGCSSPLGTLGFARAFVELDRQCAEAGLDPVAVVHTSTSGGTHAGLLVGRSLVGREVRLIAVDAGAINRHPRRFLLGLAQEAAAVIGHEMTLTADEVEVITDQLGEGYGRHTEAANRAIARLARTEAVVTDPIYSGKGLAGLVELVEAGAVGGPVVFWHTGGYHALFDPRHGGPVIA